MYNNSLEDKFLYDDECRCSIILGTRGSGKTHLFLNIVKHLYTNKLYDKFFLVIPSFKLAKSGGSNQYEEVAKMKNTVIFTAYHPSILKKITKKKQNERYFFAVDDATASAHDLTKCPDFLKFFYESRHFRISTMLIVHSARKILEKSIRANIDWFFMARCSNKKLRQDLWEEYFSLDYPKFDQFEQDYIEGVIRSDNYNIWCLDALRGNIDRNVKDWKIQHEDIKIRGTPKAEVKDIKKSEIKKDSLIPKKKEAEPKGKLDLGKLFFGGKKR